MVKNDIDNLGQLPTADRNSEIEQLSMIAFQSVLPSDKFLFRDERTNDVGVDGSLEIKIDGKFTNLRAQIQLKATDSDETNQDGSISIQVATANLNYLLNGSNALYVLYVVPKNKLYFVWARDERNRLDQTNPNWMQQQTVTIRFNDLITSETLEQIHQRIQQEARLHRQINDVLGSASNTENLIVGISPETLKITDSEQAKEILLTSGRLLVTSGYPQEVRNLSKLLDSQSENLPQILLVRAYAEHILGRYQTAYALLSEALLRRNELSEDDQQFLDFLRKSCEYLTGSLTLEEFSSYLDTSKDNISGHFAQSFRLNQIRYSILTIADVYQRREKVLELKALVQEILTDQSSSSSLKLYAKAIWLEAEGLDIATGSYLDLAANQIRMDNGLQSDHPKIAQHYAERLARWMADRTITLEEASKLGHRPILASLKFTSALILFHQLSSNLSLALFVRLPIEQVFETVYKDDVEEGVKFGIDSANEALEIYNQLSDTEGELRARLLIADFYEFVGKIDEAKEIADEVLPKAEAMGYIRQIELAKEHLANNGLRARLQSSISEHTEEEKISRTAKMTDEELSLYASQMIRIIGLPPERAEILKREYLSGRTVAQEQLSWCRHIEIHQDLRHTQNLETTYLIDPNRVCICKLHKYQSIIQNPDSESLIQAFKRTYCENCPDRNPLESS
ncbi:MAG TPA: DUF4365 domain-containing protein [Pyrinomonadaceae bacterium]|jgi:hypothetical protein